MHASSDKDNAMISKKSKKSSLRLGFLLVSLVYNFKIQI